MKRADFSVTLTPEQQQAKLALAQELRDNPLVLDLLKRYHLDEQVLQESPFLLDQWQKGLQACINCRGLAECKQKTKGYIQDLEWHEGFRGIIAPCSFEKQRLQATAHLTNYVVKDFPSEMDTISIMDVNQDHELLDEITRWMENPTDKGFYLYGPVGVGKTYVAAAVTNYLAKAHKKVAFVNVANYIGKLKGLMNTPEEFNQLVSRVRRCDFLVLDDIGAENNSAWVRDEILYPLLNSRLEEHKATWFTSNEDFETLQSHFASVKQEVDELKALRLMDRIKALSKPCKILGESRRK